MPQLIVFQSRGSRWVLAATGVVCGLVFILGDPSKWQATPSLVLMRNVPLVPLDFWGWLAVLYAVLLIPDRTKVAGYAVGAFLIGVLTVSLIVTLHEPGPKNIWGVLFGIDAFLYHCMAIRLATVSRLPR
jgi:hypothetical protein